MYSTFDKASTLKLYLNVNAAGNIITDTSGDTAAGQITVSMDMINLAGFTPNGIGGLTSNTANEAFNGAIDDFATDLLSLIDVTYYPTAYKEIATTIDSRVDD